MKSILYVVCMICSMIACDTYDAVPTYIYPVATFESGSSSHVLVLYQWPDDELELYDLHVSTGSLNKILTSWYTPAGVRILPDQSGFSFIDNGRIRIKYFAKRAVKSLDIYEPIYGIELINWLDNQTCYFHAQSDGRYGIYMLTLEEELRLVLVSASVDYMYPNIVDFELFFIERSDNAYKRNYRIGKRALVGNVAQSQTIIDFGSKVLIMLSMKSANEGFVVECDYTKEFRYFHYHHLFKQGRAWTSQKLFTFHIPQSFFLMNSVEYMNQYFLLFLVVLGIIYISVHMMTMFNILYFIDLIDKQDAPTGFYKRQGTYFLPFFWEISAGVVVLIIRFQYLYQAKVEQF